MRCAFDLRKTRGTALASQGDSDQLRDRVWPLLDTASVAPVIHAVFDLGQTVDARRLMEAREHIGKIMLRVG